MISFKVLTEYTCILPKIADWYNVVPFKWNSIEVETIYVYEGGKSIYLYHIGYLGPDFGAPIPAELLNKIRIIK